MRVWSSAGAASLILAACFSSPSYAKGALAIDTNHGSAYGFSYGYNTQSSANQRAIQECGRHRCHVVVQFSHSCAAYAADQQPGSTAYGWGYQSPGAAGTYSETKAKSRALSECVSHGGSNANCIIRVWGCDP